MRAPNIYSALIFVLRETHLSGNLSHELEYSRLLLESLPLRCDQPRILSNIIAYFVFEFAFLYSFTQPRDYEQLGLHCFSGVEGRENLCFNQDFEKLFRRK